MFFSYFPGVGGALFSKGRKLPEEQSQRWASEDTRWNWFEAQVVEMRDSLLQLHEK